MMAEYHPALSNVENYQLQGEQYIGDDFEGQARIYYEKKSEEEKNRVMEMLHNQLKKNLVEQEASEKNM